MDRAFRITLMLCLCTLISCGKKSSSAKQETRIEEQDIFEVMANQRFACASLDGGPCPAGITRLFILNARDPDHSAACSGFMVGPRTLMTNHHCVSTQEECDNTFVAIYDGTSYQKTLCKRIIKTQEDSPDPNDPKRKIDYTVFETFDPYLGEVFKLASQTPADDDVVTAWVVDQTGLDLTPLNLFDSRITEFKCRVTKDSPWSSMVMDHCPIISGNSGSPALNDRGEVVGIFWGGTSKDLDSSYDLQARRSLNRFGLATDAIFLRAPEFQFDSYLE